MGTDDHWENYDSGPFCMHFGQEDCDDKCSRCGHRCREHGYYGSEECEHEGCDCKKQEDES